MTTGEAPWAQTACILCECNCGVEVQLDGRRLHRIRGDKAHPGSQGYTCNKAMRLDHYQNGPHRLTSPTRRRADGSYEEIDWDTAIDEIAQGFTRIRDEHGGESILLRRWRPGQPSRGQLRRRVSTGGRLAVSLERAGAGEDRRGVG